MKIYKRVITTLFALMLLPTFSVYQVWAKTPQNNIRTFDEALGLSFRYLISKQNDDYSWITNNHDDTADIINLLEHLNSDPNISMFESYENFQFIIKQSADHLISKNYFNTDDVTHYLLCDILQKDEEAYSIMLNSQNPDGGFGLAENYASDIIDTKLALKALADLGETEAMTNAAMYIASLQNDDGGFSYQKGLASNPELTAEIADIFGDCIIKDQSLAYTLSETLIDLNDYLDDNLPAIEDLETNDMPEVYQHFHTALFKLKTTGSYNVTPYYDLQAEDGGVFDDPMATALFLELIARGA